MLYRKLQVLLFMIFMLEVSSCGQHPGRAGYLEIAKIPRAQEDERRTKFESYPIQEQINILLYAEYYVEGGNFAFFRYLASNGKEKIPAIVKKIETDDGSDPRTRAALIWVLNDIDMVCECVGTDPVVIESLRRNKMEIRESDSDGFRGFKLLYDQHLNEIETRANSRSM